VYHIGPGGPGGPRGSGARGEVDVVVEQIGAHLGQPEQTLLVLDGVAGDAPPGFNSRSRSHHQTEQGPDHAAQKGDSDVSARPTTGRHNRFNDLHFPLLQIACRPLCRRAAREKARKPGDSAQATRVSSPIVGRSVSILPKRRGETATFRTPLRDRTPTFASALLDDRPRRREVRDAPGEVEEPRLDLLEIGQDGHRQARVRPKVEDGAHPLLPAGVPRLPLATARAHREPEAVAREAGWNRDLLITVAAHESNWGRSELSSPPNNNLFGYKVNAAWLAAGKDFVELPTREVFDGVSQTIKAKFRAYASWADSLRDYVGLIKTAPRYAAAANAAAGNDFTGYFQAVKAGGYATDPEYAEKLEGSLAAVRSALV